HSPAVRDGCIQYAGTTYRCCNFARDGTYTGAECFVAARCEVATSGACQFEMRCGDGRAIFRVSDACTLCPSALFLLRAGDRVSLRADAPIDSLSLTLQRV